MSAGIVCVVGRPGCGKTTLIARVVAAEHKAGARALLCDPTGDIHRELRALGVDHDVHASAATEAIERKLSVRRVVLLHDRDPRDVQQTVDAFLSFAGKLEPHTVYGCDEAELLLPNVPHSKDVLGRSRAAILTLARNRKVRVVLATKRPQSLHVAARENAAHVCVFRGDSTRFLEACADFGEAEDYADAMSLPVGEFLYRGPFETPARAVFNSRGRLPFRPLLTF